MISHQVSRPPTWAVFQYSFLALPLAFAGVPLYIYGPDLYARDLGISLGLMGAVLILVRLFDAVQDPVIGFLSDRFHHRRQTIMATGLLMLAVGMGALLLGPGWQVLGESEYLAVIWFGLSLACATTGFSLATINLNTLGGFWSRDTQERTRIAAWRESLGLGGLLLASILPAALPFLMSSDSVMPIFYSLFLLMLALAAGGFFQCFRAHLAGVRFTERESEPASLFDIKRFFSGSFRHFYLLCFLTHLAASFPAGLFLFFIRDYLQAEALTGVFLCLYFLAGAAFMPLWIRLASAKGKLKAWLVSMLLAVATFFWVLFLTPDQHLAYGLVCVLSGIALGADLALPPSILADQISEQEAEGSANQAFALLGFIPKMALALATGIALMSLDGLSFQPGGANSAEALNGLLMFYALVPCVIKLIVAGLLWRWLQNQASQQHETSQQGIFTREDSH